MQLEAMEFCLKHGQKKARRLDWSRNCNVSPVNIGHRDQQGGGSCLRPIWAGGLGGHPTKVRTEQTGKSCIENKNQFNRNRTETKWPNNLASNLRWHFTLGTQESLASVSGAPLFCGAGKWNPLCI